MQGRTMHNPLTYISPTFIVGRRMLAFTILFLAFIDAIWLGAIRRMYLITMLFFTQAWKLKDILALPNALGPYYDPLQ